MDVPTLVFDPKEFFFGGRLLRNVSSCPYLSATAGAAWKELPQLSNLMQDKNLFDGFAPRQYVLKQFTDESCARQLLKLFNYN